MTTAAQNSRIVLP